MYWMTVLGETPQDSWIYNSTDEEMVTGIMSPDETGY